MSSSPPSLPPQVQSPTVAAPTSVTHPSSETISPTLPTNNPLQAIPQISSDQEHHQQYQHRHRHHHQQQQQQQEQQRPVATSDVVTSVAAGTAPVADAAYPTLYDPLAGVYSTAADHAVNAITSIPLPISLNTASATVQQQPNDISTLTTPNQPVVASSSPSITTSAAIGVPNPAQVLTLAQNNNMSAMQQTYYPSLTPTTTSTTSIIPGSSTAIPNLVPASNTIPTCAQHWVQPTANPTANIFISSNSVPTTQQGLIPTISPPPSTTTTAAATKTKTKTKTAAALATTPNHPPTPPQTQSQLPVQVHVPEVQMASAYRIGRYTPAERKIRIARYKEKKLHRNYNKRVKYDCRKTIADKRIRVQGRFVKREQEMEIAKKQQRQQQIGDIDSSLGSAPAIGGDGGGDSSYGYGGSHHNEDDDDDDEDEDDNNDDNHNDNDDDNEYHDDGVLIHNDPGGKKVQKNDSDKNLFVNTTITTAASDFLK